MVRQPLKSPHKKMSPNALTDYMTPVEYVLPDPPSLSAPACFRPTRTLEIALTDYMTPVDYTACTPENRTD